MRRTRTVLGLATIAMLLSACTPAATTGGDGGEVAEGYLAQADASIESSGTLHLQLDYDMVEATGLDPQGAEIARSWQLTRLVYDTLVDIGPNFEIVPRLAASFEQVSTTEYVFTLRDATFSNGRAVTTDDVIGSLERLRDAGNRWSFQLGSIEQMTATDERTVRITLSAPYTPFLAVLANTTAAILPMTEVRAGLDPSTEMLGSGPFMVQSHRQDEGWTFVRQPHYWGDATLGIDTVEISFLNDDQTRLAGLRDGSVALTNFTNPDALDLLAGVPHTAAVNQQQSDFFYLAMNSVNPASPFVDDALRRATNSALDREQIAEVALAGLSQPTGVTPANLPGACDPTTLPSIGGDTAALAGASFSLAVYNDDPALLAVAQVVQQQLGEAGATVTIDVFDYATYADRVFVQQPGQFDMAIGWFAGYADASAVTAWWNPTDAVFNSGYVQPHDDLNAAIDAAMSTPAGDERTATLARVCELADGYSEMVPLVSRPSVVGYRTDLVSPTILADEGYGDFLRKLTEFRLLAASGA